MRPLSVSFHPSCHLPFQDPDSRRRPTWAPASRPRGWRRGTAWPWGAPSPQLCCPTSSWSAGSETVNRRTDESCELASLAVWMGFPFFSFSRFTAASVQQCGHQDGGQWGFHHFKGCTEGAWRCLHCAAEDVGLKWGTQGFCLHHRWGPRGKVSIHCYTSDIYQHVKGIVHRKIKIHLLSYEQNIRLF